MKNIYRTTGYLRINGKKILPGETVILTEEQAAQMPGFVQLVGAAEPPPTASGKGKKTPPIPAPTTEAIPPQTTEPTTEPPVEAGATEGE